MDFDAQERLEELENLVKETLKAVNALRTDFASFREEQRAENAKTQALLRQLGARVGSVEGRVSAGEERIQAVEQAVFSQADEA